MEVISNKAKVKGFRVELREGGSTTGRARVTKKFKDYNKAALAAYDMKRAARVNNAGLRVRVVATIESEVILYDEEL